MFQGSIFTLKISSRGSILGGSVFIMTGPNSCIGTPLLTVVSINFHQEILLIFSCNISSQSLNMSRYIHQTYIFCAGASAISIESWGAVFGRTIVNPSAPPPRFSPRSFFLTWRNDSWHDVFRLGNFGNRALSSFREDGQVVNLVPWSPDLRSPGPWAARFLQRYEWNGRVFL